MTSSLRPICRHPPVTSMRGARGRADTRSCPAAERSICRKRILLLDIDVRRSRRWRSRATRTASGRRATPQFQRCVRFRYITPPPNSSNRLRHLRRRRQHVIAEHVAERERHAAGRIRAERIRADADRSAARRNRATASACTAPPAALGRPAAAPAVAFCSAAATGPSAVVRGGRMPALQRQLHRRGAGQLRFRFERVDVVAVLFVGAEDHAPAGGRHRRAQRGDAAHAGDADW